MSDMLVSCAKTAEQIVMPFGVGTGDKEPLFDGVDHPGELQLGEDDVVLCVRYMHHCYRLR